MTAMLTQEEILYKLIQGDKGKAWVTLNAQWNIDDVFAGNSTACDWKYVTCDPYTRNVTALIINNQTLGALEATIPSELGLLKSLTTLDLEGNKLYGSIPNELFSGLPNLLVLILTRNNLEGTLPSLTNSLRSLRVFDVAANRLAGTIQSGIGDAFRSLEKLDLSHNGFVGSIPKSIGNCKQLGYLDLSTNLLDGTIPKEIGKLPNLKGLFLNDNKLVGTIPYTLARSDLQLIQMFLQHNDLSGTVPASLGDVTTLSSLFVDGNKLTGDIPADLCRRSPTLNNEFFQGDYATTSRDGCTSISCPVDSISKEGVAPCFPCDNGQYRYLGMERHQCANITEREILKSFFGSTNGLNWHNSLGWGLDDVDICDWVGVDCGPYGRVVNITLRDMNLQGTIPSELGLLSYLKVLDLADNKLTGYLPSDLRFTLLERLDVSGNRLRGIVPPLLCMDGDINDNGANGVFNCDYIACPVGTYSTSGYMTQTFDTSGNAESINKCVLCNDKSASYLGMKTCTSPIFLGSLDYSAAKNIAIAGAILVSFTLIFVVCFAERNKRRSRALRAVAAEEILTLEQTDFEYEKDIITTQQSEFFPKTASANISSNNSPEEDHPQPSLVDLTVTAEARGTIERGSGSENELWLDVPNII